jgi:DnaJ-class molecular chaperone
VKQAASTPTEQKCPECEGKGFPEVKQPVKPGRRIYPAPCQRCGGKGWISLAAE